MADKIIKSKYLPEASDPLAFDYTKTAPTFYTTLELAGPQVLQSFFIDYETGDIYAAQSYSNPSGKAESFRITRTDKYGNMLDNMILTYGGHGTTFGMEHIAAGIRIWTNYCETDASGATTGYRVCRLPYRPNETVTIDDPNLVKYDTFGLGYVVPTTDEQNDYVAYRYDEGGVQKVQRRKLSEVKAGINKVYGIVNIPAELDYMQGLAMDGDDLYWRTGDTNDANTIDYIVRFSFVDGQEKQRIRCRFGADIDGVIEENFREPEGIHVYKDPISGKKSIVAGVVTGGLGRRIYKLYAYHQLGNGEKFALDTANTLQRYPLTKSTGQAKRIDPSITELSNIRDPGTYYMDTAQSGTFSDHPSPGDAGWYLIVGAPDATGNVFQTLRRNTAATANIMIYERNVQVGGQTQWSKAFGNFATQIESSVKSLTKMIYPGTYYMTTAIAAAMTDHPRPGDGGWFLKVEGKDVGTGSIYQTLLRNTGVGNHEKWIRCMNYVNGNYEETPWELVGGYFTQGVPSVTSIDKIKAPGYYYLSTSQSSALTDHPDKGVAGWFLEVSPRNDINTFNQTLIRNTSVQPDMQQYTRRVVDGVAGPWKNLMTSKKTLWSGNTKNDFASTFNLSEPLTNFDLIYFKIDSDAGLNANERVVMMSEWQSDELQFQMVNLSNVVGNTGFWLFELAFQFSAAKDSFTMKRAIRLNLTSSGSQTRTDNDPTMGMLSIIGVRL